MSETGVTYNGEILDEEEIALLWENLCAAGEGATVENMQKLIDWATEARLDAALVEGILKGDFLAWYRDGKLMVKPRSVH